MAALSNAKAGSTFTNRIETISVVYDFAVDAGAAGALDIFTPSQDVVIHRVIAKVKTLCTSGGSATVEVGKAGATAIAMAQTAVASLTAGAVIDSHLGSIKLASGTPLQQLIATAALTAGKIEYQIEYSKF